MQDPSSARPTHGGNLAWAASLANCSPSLILDFSASINPLGPPQSAIAAIQTHLNLLQHYPDPEYRSLRLALSQVHQISPDWILPGNGSAELLTWAGRDLAALQATYLPTPAFKDYERALKAFEAKVIPCPLAWEESRSHDGRATAEGMATSVLRPLSSVPRFQPRGLLLNNPHNPTGKLFLRQEVLPLLQDFALVVVDEAFMDFLPPDRQQSVAEWVMDYPNLVVLRSLTKFYSLPGLRLGYAIAHPDRLQRWRQWRDPWSVNSLAVAAAEAVLQDTPFQQQTWHWLEEARAQLFNHLTALPALHPYPSAANFLLVRCDQSVVERQHYLLQQHHILIRDCLSFPELGDRYFRIAVRTEADHQRLLDGLSRFSED